LAENNIGLTVGRNINKCFGNKDRRGVRAGVNGNRQALPNVHALAGGTEPNTAAAATATTDSYIKMAQALLLRSGKC